LLPAVFPAVFPAPGAVYLCKVKSAPTTARVAATSAASEADKLAIVKKTNIDHYEYRLHGGEENPLLVSADTCR